MLLRLASIGEYCQTTTAKAISPLANKIAQSRESSDMSGPVDISHVDRNGEAEDEDAGDVDEVPRNQNVFQLWVASRRIVG